MGSIGLRAWTVQFFIFRWSTVFGRFKNTVKSREAVESRTHGNLRNGQIRFDQQLFCVSNAFLDNIVVAGGICKLLKEPGKMKLGEAGKRSQFVYGNVFGAVLGNVVADVHEFIHIFVLLARRNAGEHFLGIDVGASKRYKKADHQGIDGRLCIGL